MVDSTRNRSKKLTELPEATEIGNDSILYVVNYANSTPNTYQMNFENLTNAISNTIILREAPANSTDNVALNVIRIADEKLYIAIDNTQWGYVTLTSY